MYFWFVIQSACFFSRGNLKKHLVLLSRAADSICDGDIVDRQIRSKQNWNLLPTQVSTALMSFVGVQCKRLICWNWCFRIIFMTCEVHGSCSILCAYSYCWTHTVSWDEVFRDFKKLIPSFWSIGAHGTHHFWCVAMSLLCFTCFLSQPLTRLVSLSKHRGSKLCHCTIQWLLKHWQDLCLKDYHWHQRMYHRLLKGISAVSLVHPMLSAGADW